MNKFRDREGPFVSLPEWIKRFDFKVQSGFEDYTKKLRKHEKQFEI